MPSKSLLLTFYIEDMDMDTDTMAMMDIMDIGYLNLLDKVLWLLLLNHYYQIPCCSFKNKQGIAETAKTNGPTCDNMCIQKI